MAAFRFLDEYNHHIFAPIANALIFDENCYGVTQDQASNTVVGPALAPSVPQLAHLHRCLKSRQSADNGWVRLEGQLVQKLGSLRQNKGL